MIKHTLSISKAIVPSSTLLRAAAALSGVLIAVGFATAASAQSPNGDMARCEQLYGAWSRYNGTSAYSKTVGPEMALEECRKGNFAAGEAQLTQILQRAQIPVPASEAVAAH